MEHRLSPLSKAWLIPPHFQHFLSSLFSRFKPVTLSNLDLFDKM